MAGRVLRQGIDPPVDQYLDRVNVDTEHRGQIVAGPRLQLVIVGAGDVVTEAAERHPQQFGVAAGTPFPGRERDGLGMQRFSGGHQNTGLSRKGRAGLDSHRQHCGRGHRDSPGRRRGMRCKIHQQRGRLRGGHRQDDGIGLPGPAGVVVELPARTRSGNAAYRRLDPVRPGAHHQSVEQHLVPAVESAEDRPAARSRQDRADRFGQTSGAGVEGGGHRRHRRPHADARCRSGVHPGHQRVDRAGHHLVAEPVGDHVAERGIRARLPPQGPVRLSGDLRAGGGVDETGHQFGRTRDAVDCADRQGVQPVLAVHDRAHPGGSDQSVRQTEFGEERRDLRAAGDEGLGTDVHRLAAKPLGPQDAARTVGRVEHGDVGLFADGTADSVGSHQT